MVDFLKKLKIIAKILATFRNNVYLCTQNNGRVPFIGIGVSPIGRVVRFVATLFSCPLRHFFNVDLLCK